MTIHRPVSSYRIMHPPRLRRTSEPQGIADRLVDWLLSHCPFSTLTVLSILVIGPTLGPIPQPLLIAVPVVLADVLFVIMRRMITSESHGHSHSTSLGAK
jgi:hypothetical protein